MNKILYVCIIFIKEYKDGHSSWYLKGVFSKREDAVKACTEWNHGVGEVELDKDLGDELLIWDPEVEYPLNKQGI